MDEPPPSEGPPTLPLSPVEDTGDAELPELAGGRYELGPCIGRGGASEVFRARDVVLGREVALKFLRAGASTRSAEDTAAFLREARAQAKLEHPHICRVYEIDRLGEKTFIAMQRVDGPTLLEARGALSLEDKLTIMRAIAEALHYAHGQGLVHRDLKPANIMLERGPGGATHPYLMDFGTARDLHAPSATATGTIIGTPSYMAPEQARGEVNQLDRRTDVYGLGATLYDLLSGRPPVQGDSMEAVLRRLLVEDTIPLKKWVPSIAVDLETIVMKALERDPARRYESAAAFGEDLRAFLDGEPIRARRISPLSRALRRLAKNRAALASLIFSALVLASGLGYGAYTAWTRRELIRAGEQLGKEAAEIESALERAALLPRHDLRPERRAVRERMKKLEEQMSAIGPLAERAGSSALGRASFALHDYAGARAYLQRAGVPEEGEEDPDLLATLGLTLGKLYEREREETNRIPAGELRDATARRINTELRDPALRVLNRAAARATDPGRAAHLRALIAFYEGRLENALQASAGGASAIESDAMRASLEGAVHLAQAGVLRDQGRLDAALQALHEGAAADARASSIARSDELVAASECRAWQQALELECSRGNAGEEAFARADEACKRATEIDEDSAEAHFQSALLALERGDCETRVGKDPRPWLERAVRSTTRVVELDPRETGALIEQGTALDMIADYEGRHGVDPNPSIDAAIAALDRAIALQPSEARAHGVLGNIYVTRALEETRTGVDPRVWLEKSIAHYQAALALVPELVRVRYNLGYAWTTIGEYDLAAARDPGAAFAKALESFDDALAKNPSYANAAKSRGDMLREWAQYRADHGEAIAELLEKARASLSRAVELNPGDFETHTRLAQLAMLEAERARALKEVRAAGEHLEDALREATKATEMNPRSSGAHEVSAEVHRARAELAAVEGRSPKRELDAGLELAAKAEAINARNAGAFSAEGRLRVVLARGAKGAQRKREAQRALAALDAARAIDPLSEAADAAWTKEARAIASE